MVSVSDALGGVTNLTLPLNISAVPADVVSDTNAIIANYEKLRTQTAREIPQLALFSLGLTYITEPRITPADVYSISRLESLLLSTPS